VRRVRLTAFSVIMSPSRLQLSSAKEPPSAEPALLTNTSTGRPSF
jgi:hypothetical protein